MDDKSLGKEVFTRSYDPNFVTGYGNRPYNWGLGRVGPAGSPPARLGERRLFPQLVGQLVCGRQPVDDGRRTTRRSASWRRSIRGCRAAAARRSAACTTSSRPRSGSVDELAQASSNFAKQIENWQGVDVNVSARLRNGLTVQGGTSTGRRLADTCAVRAVLPELGAGANGGANNSIAGSTAGNAQSVVNPYCRVVEPYQTQVRGSRRIRSPRWASR